ncbi:MAG: ATP-binding protein [Spirochaetia bacterium]
MNNKKPLKVSIRLKTLFLIVLIILIPFIVLSAFLVNTAHSILIDQFQDRQMDILSGLQDSVVDRHIQDMEQVVHILSRVEGLPNIFEDSVIRDRVYRQWQFTREVFPYRSWVYYGNNQGRLLVCPPWNPGDENYDCRTRPWYQNALVSEEPVLSDPYIEYGTGKIVFTVSQAVRDARGNVLGVFGADTFIDDFVSLFQYQSQELTFPLFIFVEEGNVLNERGVDERFLSIPQWGEMHTDSEDSIQFSVENEVYYASFIYINRLHLYLAAIVSQSAVYAEIQPIIITLLHSLVFMLVFVIIGALIFSAYIIQKIELLHGYMREISSTEDNTRVVVSGKDEFYDLNIGINQMVTTMTESIQTVDSIFHLLSHNISNNLFLLSESIRKQMKYARPHDVTLRAEQNRSYHYTEAIRKLISSVMISNVLNDESADSLNKDVIDVSSVLDFAIKRVFEKSEKKDQSIMKHGIQEDTYIMADEGLLIEALENILDNAVKYSPFNSEIEVSLMSGNEHVMVIIADHGPGFTDEDKTKLFTRYTKLSAKPTGDELSNGLGLAVSKEIIEKMGGFISLVSWPGYGAVFQISFAIVSCENTSSNT